MIVSLSFSKSSSLNQPTALKTALLSILLTVVVFMPSARAQFFYSNVAVTQDSDVLTDGTTVLAFDLHDSATHITSVNGVAFSGSYIQNGVTFATTLSSDTTAGAVQQSGMTTNFENILTTNGYHLASGSFTLSNLTPGASYELQIFAASTGGAQGTETLTDGSANGVLAFGTLFASGTPSAADYIIETFTANISGTETISVADKANTNAVVFNAVNLRELPVPEPGTWALMIGGLAVLFGVQRSRKLNS